MLSAAEKLLTASKRGKLEEVKAALELVTDYLKELSEVDGQGEHTSSWIH